MGSGSCGEWELWRVGAVMSGSCGEGELWGGGAAVRGSCSEWELWGVGAVVSGSCSEGVNRWAHNCTQSLPPSHQGRTCGEVDPKKRRDIYQVADVVFAVKGERSPLPNICVSACTCIRPRVYVHTIPLFLSPPFPSCLIPFPPLNLFEPKTVHPVATKQTPRGDQQGLQYHSPLPWQQ